MSRRWEDTVSFIKSLTRRFASLACLAAIAASAAGPARAQETLNVYSIWPENWARPMLQEFEAASGIKVNFLRFSSGEALARIIAEKNNPRVDVLFGGPVETFAAGIKENVFENYKPPSAAALPARFKNAETLKREPMVKNHTTFFVPWETIHESNPQEILERHEAVTLVPLLIMQGALDDNVRPAVQEKFARTYQAAGGDVQFHLFEDCEHEWVARPGPQTDRAREMVKAFIARQLKR